MKPPVLKTGVPQGTAGSNPAPSASKASLAKRPACLCSFGVKLSASKKDGCCMVSGAAASLQFLGAVGGVTGSKYLFSYLQRSDTDRLRIVSGAEGPSAEKLGAGADLARLRAVILTSELALNFAAAIAQELTAQVIHTLIACSFDLWTANLHWFHRKRYCFQFSRD